MREIKFRAWSHESPQFMLYEDNKEICQYDNSLTWGDWFKKHLHEILSDDTDWTVMQYTGIKDKNGREIYEGDIVKAEDIFGSHIKRVGYVDSHAAFQLGDLKMFMLNNHSMSVYMNIEVIGNIYENPELLIQNI